MAEVKAKLNKDGDKEVDVMVCALYPNQWMVYPFDESKPLPEALKGYVRAKVVFPAKG